MIEKIVNNISQATIFNIFVISPLWKVTNSQKHRSQFLSNTGHSFYQSFENIFTSQDTILCSFHSLLLSQLVDCSGTYTQPEMKEQKVNIILKTYFLKSVGTTKHLMVISLKY